MSGDKTKKKKSYDNAATCDEHKNNWDRSEIHFEAPHRKLIHGISRIKVSERPKNIKQNRNWREISLSACQYRLAPFTNTPEMRIRSRFEII